MRATLVPYQMGVARPGSGSLPPKSMPVSTEALAGFLLSSFCFFLALCSLGVMKGQESKGIKGEEPECFQGWPNDNNLNQGSIYSTYFLLAIE